MKMKRIFLLCSALLLAVGLQAQTIEWSAASHPDMRQVGYPQVVQTPLGAAFWFDGQSGLFFDQNPLEGMTQLTLEVIFKPDGDGRFAQRFMHLGHRQAQRIMFETRVNPDKRWYFDAHIQMPVPEGQRRGPFLTMIDSTLLHPTDQWYSAVLVLDGKTGTTYINGVQELTGPMEYQPINGGQSSVGVRQNLVDYFKGTIYKIRVTPKVLKPSEFLKDHQALNGDK